MAFDCDDRSNPTSRNSAEEESLAHRGVGLSWKVRRRIAYWEWFSQVSLRAPLPDHVWLEYSTLTSGVATATVPYSGHLPLNFSTRFFASWSVTPLIWKRRLTELNSDTSERTGLERSIDPMISTSMPFKGIPSDFDSTWINSTPQEATAERNSSPGVTSSPGQPFCSGPSITKW